jgi:hypothetical protein
MELMEIAQLLGNFGEFVGAIAVVLTLIYLAVQVRHSKESMDENTRALEENRTLTRADMERQFVQQWDQVNYQISENRDIASIIRRGIEDVESLDEDDRTIFNFRMSNRIDFYYAAMRLARDGFIGEEYASSVAATIPVMLGQSGALALWQEIGSSYPPSFQQHVNSRLRSSA